MEALAYFTENPVIAALKAPRDVGLVYVALGQLALLDASCAPTG